jgi:hypothetical protein
LVSLEALIYTRLGTLTEEKIQELMRVGIEDMYTRINVDFDILGALPWLDENSLEDLGKWYCNCESGINSVFENMIQSDQHNQIHAND